MTLEKAQTDHLIHELKMQRVDITIVVDKAPRHVFFQRTKYIKQEEHMPSA